MIGIIALGLSTLVILSGLYLLSKSKKDGLGNLYIFSSYSAIALGAMLFVGTVVVGGAMMMRCHKGMASSSCHMQGPGGQCGAMASSCPMMGHQGGSCMSHGGGQCSHGASMCSNKSACMHGGGAACKHGGKCSMKNGGMHHEMMNANDDDEDDNEEAEEAAE